MEIHVCVSESGSGRCTGACGTESAFRPSPGLLTDFRPDRPCARPRSLLSGSCSEAGRPLWPGDPPRRPVGSTDSGCYLSSVMEAVLIN